jgi:hypothetical protein
VLSNPTLFFDIRSGTFTLITADVIFITLHHFLFVRRLLRCGSRTHVRSGPRDGTLAVEKYTLSMLRISRGARSRRFYGSPIPKSKVNELGRGSLPSRVGQPTKISLRQLSWCSQHFSGSLPALSNHNNILASAPRATTSIPQCNYRLFIRLEGAPPKKHPQSRSICGFSNRASSPAAPVRIFRDEPLEFVMILSPPTTIMHYALCSVSLLDAAGLYIHFLSSIPSIECNPFVSPFSKCCTIL